MSPIATKDVLVVDSLDFYRRMMTELLQGQGYAVHEAASADAARELLRRERVDLLLLDLDLPPTGAASLLEEIQQSRGSLRTVLVVPSNQDDADLDRYRELGVGHTVARSAPLDDIAAAARAALFPETKNLRRSPRAQVHIPVVYGTADEPTSVTTHTFNVSADGMFLVTCSSAPAPPGTRLRMRFWVPTTDHLIDTEGIVIWCNQAGGRMNELYPPGMGVMFLGVAAADARNIDEYVRQRVAPPF